MPPDAGEASGCHFSRVRCEVVLWVEMAVSVRKVLGLVGARVVDCWEREICEAWMEEISLGRTMKRGLGCGMGSGRGCGRTCDRTSANSG